MKRDTMKHKNLAVTASADMAGRALAALNAKGEEIAAKLNGNDSLQLVKARGQFSALIRHGNTTVQIEGYSFAVTTHD